MSDPREGSSIALRSWLAPKKEKMGPEAANVELAQLLREREQNLRFITEQSLQEEIDVAKHEEGDDVMEGVEGEEAGKDAPTREARLQQLALARQHMWRNAEVARNNAEQLLDLMRMILARDPKRLNDPVTSPDLRGAEIPTGTVAVQKSVERTKHGWELERDEYERERLRIGDKGSRMHALDWATDNLLKAATELETEVRKEEKYWNEILSISEKGWNLQRLRKGQRHSPFAVRHGSREASEPFKSRGYAPLQMDSDGSIVLDPILTSQTKTLRVRISDNGNITGTSHSGVPDDDATVGIEKSIKLARDSLLEEEMFHEMSLETRQLSAYGVELRDSAVYLEMPNAEHPRKIVIDLISRDENTEGSEDHSNDWLAQSIVRSVRLLLTHTHRMRRYERSQLPPPMSENVVKRTVRPPFLIRTLLAIFSHTQSVTALDSYFRSAERSLLSAGLRSPFTISRETSLDSVTKTLETSSSKDLPLVDQIIELFVKPLNAVLTLTLPSPAHEELKIASRTFFDAPTFGTEYKVSVPPSLAFAIRLARGQHSADLKFPSVAEVTSFVDWLLALDLSQNYLGKEFGSQASIRSQEPKICVGVKHGNKVVRKEVGVTFEKAKLVARVGAAPLPIDGGSETTTFTWEGKIGDGDFRAKIREAVGL